MLQHRYVLLPCTFDSGGLLGPLISALLFGQDNIHHPILRISDPRPKRNLVTPQAEAMVERAMSVVPSPGLFILANSNWHDSRPFTAFTEQYPLTLPSQWATAVIGNDLVLSIGRHIYTAPSLARRPHTNTKFKASACEPRQVKAKLHKLHFPPQFDMNVR